MNDWFHRHLCLKNKGNSPAKRPGPTFGPTLRLRLNAEWAARYEPAQASQSALEASQIVLSAGKEPRLALDRPIAASVDYQRPACIALNEAQLCYYKARVYDPATGRFQQTDPIGYKDDLNLYAHVGGVR